MTRRERKEAKLAKRQEWAGKAHGEAAGRHRAAQSMADHMTGEPVKIGHHSEGRHRRDIERLDGHMRAGIEADTRAKHHEDVAAGIQRQLDTSIFSDDPDAIEALESKVVKLEAKRDRMKRENAAVKKHGAAGLVALGWSEAGAAKAVALAAETHEKKLHAGYELSLAGAEIRRCRKRIAEIQTRQAKQAAAASAGGTMVERRGDQAIVTFSEPPGRAVTHALRDAGFRWSGVSWYGPVANLPEGIDPQCP